MKPMLLWTKLCVEQILPRKERFAEGRASKRRIAREAARVHGAMSCHTRKQRVPKRQKRAEEQQTRVLTKMRRNVANQRT